MGVLEDTHYDTARIRIVETDRDDAEDQWLNVAQSRFSIRTANVSASFSLERELLRANYHSAIGSALKDGRCSAIQSAPDKVSCLLERAGGR
ncbi:hypothetical protein R1flu_019515 [Riccia fluitans]|uniref:Uncharacterized protein n=1 Tax=Riccia fluitans TaxID=41844 RepID=A0ABD1ZJ75_9MARC